LSFTGMAVDFPCLPHRAVNNICKLLGKTSLFQMRKISKSTKSIMDSLIYSCFSHAPDVYIRKYSGEVIVSFEVLEYVVTRKYDCELWRIAYISSLTDMGHELPT
ncbi:hypothetical protein PMAYCL1PPCAC_21272, partial [Pristionchus mayeri]